LHNNTPQIWSLSRRRLLAAGGGLALGLSPLGAAAKLVDAPERALSFFNTHTGEALSAVYWADGRYVEDAQQDLNHILRDWRTDEVATMDPRLLDMLYALRRAMDSEAPFHIISGYRSPKTNAKLRQHSNGVAKRSLHMRGMAVDIRLAGRELKHLVRAAKNLKAGGVGYYPKPDFIHIDTGRVRSW